MSRWVPAFFAVSACSWMPHWACHYYRLETDSTFVVGSWTFSRHDSMAALAVYTLLVIANVAAVAWPPARPAVAITSGTLHLAFAALHAARLHTPFAFEVLGYPWSLAASTREVAIVGLFGVASIAIGILVAAVPRDGGRE